MTIADYILQRLVDAGIAHTFGIYGAANAHLFDSFHRVKGITMIPTAHEQGAGFMAEGYAKAKGPFGVAIATSGPGALNLATPIANCFYDSVPVLFICGQVSTTVMRNLRSTPLRQRGFQECDIWSVFQPISKYCRNVFHIHEVQETLDAAFTLMTQGRPGPAVLSIPLDILAAQVPDAWPHSIGTIADNAWRTPDVRECVRAWNKAERPVIIAGGGTLECASELRALAEYFDTPLFPTWNAIEIAPDDWDYFGGRVGTYGGKGRNFAVQQADFALVIGCRISGRITGGATKSFLRAARAGHGLWHVDVDRGVLHGIDEDIPERKQIHAYAASFIGAVEHCEDVLPHAHPGWNKDVRRWRTMYDPVTVNGPGPYEFIRALSQLAPSNAIVVSDCGGNTVIVHQAWEVKRGQRIISNHGNSPMGGSMAYAMGAAIAQPERPVICVIGDGGFTLGAAELNTIRIQAALGRLKNLRVMVLNNKILGITRAWQRMNLDGRISACGPDVESGYSAPDVVMLSSVGYGVSAAPCHRPEIVVIGMAQGEGPVILDVQFPGWDTYAPRVTGWDRPIEEMLPSLPKEEFLAQMKYVSPMPGWEKRRGS